MPDEERIINEDGEIISPSTTGEHLPAVFTDSTQIMPYDHSAAIALLPERMAWDKKQAKFVSETIETPDLEFRLISSMLLWALWSDVVGQPLEIVPGETPPDASYEPGIRLMIEVEDLGFYYLDNYGLSFKWAQGVVKRAQATGGLVSCRGNKPISTKNGVFYLPVIVKDAQ